MNLTMKCFACQASQAVLSQHAGVLKRWRQNLINHCHTDIGGNLQGRPLTFTQACAILRTLCALSKYSRSICFPEHRGSGWAVYLWLRFPSASVLRVSCLHARIQNLVIISWVVPPAQPGRRLGSKQRSQLNCCSNRPHASLMSLILKRAVTSLWEANLYSLLCLFNSCSWL